jgi:hypothetical protein
VVAVRRIDTDKLLAYYDRLGIACRVPDDWQLDSAVAAAAARVPQPKGKAIKPGRPAKGSAEAKARMAKVRGLKGKEKASEAEDSE